MEGILPFPGARRTADPHRAAVGDAQSPKTHRLPLPPPQSHPTLCPAVHHSPHGDTPRTPNRRRNAAKVGKSPRSQPGGRGTPSHSGP